MRPRRRKGLTARPTHLGVRGVVRRHAVEYRIQAADVSIVHNTLTSAQGEQLSIPASVIPANLSIPLLPPPPPRISRCSPSVVDTLFCCMRPASCLCGTPNVLMD